MKIIKSQIIFPILVGILIAGSSPWWWKILTEDKRVAECIKIKTENALQTIRKETANLVGVTAEKASIVKNFGACRTITNTQIQYGSPAPTTEVIYGKPRCKITKTNHRGRTKITECKVKDGKPFIKAEVRGKGCEFSTTANFVLITEYKKQKLTNTEKNSIKNICIQEEKS